MPLVFFPALNDPRMLATVDVIRRPLAQGGLAAGGLVYRYYEIAPVGAMVQMASGASIFSTSDSLKVKL